MEAGLVKDLTLPSYEEHAYLLQGNQCPHQEPRGGPPSVSQSFPSPGTLQCQMSLYPHWNPHGDLSPSWTSPALLSSPERIQDWKMLQHIIIMATAWVKNICLKYDKPGAVISMKIKNFLKRDLTLGALKQLCILINFPNKCKVSINQWRLKEETLNLIHIKPAHLISTFNPSSSSAFTMSTLLRRMTSPTATCLNKDKEWL